MLCNMITLDAFIVLASLTILIALLIWNKIERHWIGLAIAVVLVVTGVVSPSEAIKYVNWDVLGLILGVGIFTVYLERSGLATLAARYILKHSKGSPYTTVFLLSLLAGLVSIFMENVSVVLLFYPVVFTISRSIEIDPRTPMILMALSANIAGSATMIGDPPALITAGAFNLSFTDFIFYKGKPSMFFFTLVSMIVAIALSAYLSVKRNARIMSSRGVDHAVLGYDSQGSLDEIFVWEAAFFLSIKIILLSLRNILSIPLSFSAFIAVSGITIARLIHRDRGSVKEAFRHGFEWRLLIFLASLFILSGAFEKHGIAKILAEYLVKEFSYNIFGLTSVIMWLCVALSSVIDNVPITLTMIPIVKTMSSITSHDPVILMWAALIGITLGGNFTYIGASANVTAVRMLEKNGYKIGFLDFMKVSIIYNATSVLLAWLLYSLIYIVA